MIFPECLIVCCALAVLLWYGISQMSSTSESSEPNKLLFILLDGLRWDQLDKFSDEELPGFTRLRKNGVAAEALIPIFPSVSVVNYYSIISGDFTLQQESCAIAKMTAR